MWWIEFDVDTGKIPAGLECFPFSPRRVKMGRLDLCQLTGRYLLADVKNEFDQLEHWYINMLNVYSYLDLYVWKFWKTCASKRVFYPQTTVIFGNNTSRWHYFSSAHFVPNQKRDHNQIKNKLPRRIDSANFDPLFDKNNGRKVSWKKF